MNLYVYKIVTYDLLLLVVVAILISVEAACVWKETGAANEVCQWTWVDLQEYKRKIIINT
jgi:hypothetical protein